MSEASAAMGIASLESLDDFIATKAANMARYRDGLRDLAGVTLREIDANESNCHYVVLDVDAARSGLGRDGLCAALWAENVLARRYFLPGCHRAEPYRSMPEATRRELPVTDAALARVLVLPTGTATSPETIDQICELVRWCVTHGEEIADLLRRDGI
jgi:dTDP-4-amino-4,6-dideoxygalactose transaminase